MTSSAVSRCAFLAAAVLPVFPVSAGDECAPEFAARLGGRAWDVEIGDQGEIYASFGAAGVHQFRIVEGELEFLGTLPPLEHPDGIGAPSTARLCLSGRRLFASGKQGTQIWDLSDAGAPTLLGVVPADATGSDPHTDVEVIGDTAYISASNTALVIADVSDPVSPVIRSEIDTPGRGPWYSRIEVASGVAYVRASTGQIAMFNVNDPDAPGLIGVLPSGLAQSEAGMRVVGESLVVVAGQSNADLEIYDISAPGDPEFIASLDLPGYADFNADIAVLGTTVAVAVGGVALVDLSDPASPVFLGAVADPPSSPASPAILGGELVVGWYREGMAAYDISDPSTIALSAEYPIWDNVLAVAIDDATLFVSRDLSYNAPDDTKRIASYDVTDPDRPRFVGYATGGYKAGGLSARDGVLVTTDPLVSIYTRSTVGDMSLAAELPRFTSHIAHQPPFLYRASSEEQYPYRRWLETFDLGDPAAPMLLGQIEIPGHPESLDVSDGVICAGFGDELRVYSTGADGSAGFAGAVSFQSAIIDCVIMGESCAVQTSLDLRIVDLRDPSAPSLYPPSAEPLRPYRIFRHGEQLWAVLPSEPGASLIDLTQPAAPLVVGASPFVRSSITDVASHDDVIASSSDYGGVRLVRAPGCAATIRCTVADFEEPFGLLDLADILAFIGHFSEMSAAGDLDGNGLFDIADIVAFVTEFTSGCP